MISHLLLKNIFIFNINLQAVQITGIRLLRRLCVHPDLRVKVAKSGAIVVIIVPQLRYFRMHDCPTKTPVFLTCLTPFPAA